MTHIRLSTVVIDPGHGGKDPGTLSNKIYEKNINLSIALTLGELITKSYPDVKVIYTRSTDKFIALHERANIANKSKADLFISLHVNASTSKSPYGTQSFVMGLDKSNSNMAACRLENSVVTLEDDYSSKYSGFDPNDPESYIIFSLLQNSHLEQSLLFASMIQDNLKLGPIKKDRGVAQAPFLVLWQCTMPSVLVEVGFLSNPQDYKILINKEHQKSIATSIFKAFKKYKAQYDKDIEIIIDTTSKNLPETPVVQPPAPRDTTYAIQIMATSKMLKDGAREFKGLTCRHIQSGKLYKYYYGNFDSLAEAQKRLPYIKKKFPQAFIIPIK